MLEAMGCARPVFAFNTGGISEAVDRNVGAISRPGAIAPLINVFWAARDAGTLPALGYAARKRAVERFSLTTFLKAHEKLYGLSRKD